MYPLQIAWVIFLTVVNNLKFHLVHVLQKLSTQNFIFSWYDTKCWNCGIKYLPIKIRILHNYCTMFSITNKLQERLPVWGYHLFGSDCTLIKFTSHHFNFCTLLWWWAYQILLNFMFKVYFSSPELTAQWSYCDNFLSGIRPSFCLSVFLSYCL